MSRQKNILSKITESAYVEVVRDDECSNDVCHDEILQINQRIRDCKQKIEKSKQKYHEALVLNLKKDLSIEQLKKQLTLYDEFRGIFSDTAVEELRKMNDSQKKDSLFIYTALKDLYRNDLTRLKHITYSGRTKEPMTPEKKKHLKDIFTERLKNSIDSTDRLAYLGKHVKTAIENTNKTQN